MNPYDTFNGRRREIETIPFEAQPENDMCKIKRAEDAVFEALTDHSPVAVAAAVHRAFAEYIRGRTQTVVEDRLDIEELIALDQVAEIGKRIGRSIAGERDAADDTPRRRKTDRPADRQMADLAVLSRYIPPQKPARPGLYVVDADGRLVEREL